MIAHSVPFVRYKNVVINLEKVDYAIVSKNAATYSTTWTMIIYFSTMIGTGARKLTWTFKTEADAYLALDEFENLNDKFVISEFP